MHMLLYGAVGALLGALLGAAGPVGYSSYLAAEANYAPGAGAGTFFSLLLLFTIPVGAFLGTVVGVLIGRMKGG